MDYYVCCHYCRREYKDHASDEKCLFSPTYFSPCAPAFMLANAGPPYSAVVWMCPTCSQMPRMSTPAEDLLVECPACHSRAWVAGCRK